VLKRSLVRLALSMSVALVLLPERPAFSQLTDKTQTTTSTRAKFRPRAAGIYSRPEFCRRGRLEQAVNEPQRDHTQNDRDP
jgi:hypothetical protein